MVVCSESIVLDKVSKTFTATDGVPVRAIDEISLVVNEREFVSILGPSGCGKTTLLNLIAGLIPPDHGSIIVENESPRLGNPRVGLIFQESSVFPWRTLRKNVELGLEIRKIPPSKMSKISDEMIKLVGLSGFENKYPHELSGGMNQRVALARTLALDPGVLIMDEPFGALDVQTRLLLGLDLLRIKERTGKTMLLVTHSIDEACLLSNRVFVLTARPSRVKEVIRVNLPAKRDTNTLLSSEFRTAYESCWSLLGQEIAKSQNESK